MLDKLIENRQIRVFISSTFRDMQDERDELMKKTFPMLRRKAAERDVTLTELDLRWGITPEESQSGRVVEICLREIENSEPFFVGIIGNRYGWIPSPSDLGESLRERFSRVDSYVERHLSVTEMEMQFGVLERSEDLHAFFFIKKEEADDVDEPEKLAALKVAVRSNGHYPVSTYSSPEDLAGQVEEAFTKLLDELYPEGSLSELEKERIGQRAYLNSLCQNYVRTDANFAAIDEWLLDWEKHQLVITGASGLGKSALVANWIKEKLSLKEELPYRIIYHFVGNGGSVGSHNHVIKALCDEIRDQFGFDIDEKDTKTDEKALEELVNMVAAQGDKPLLIVLDAINQIINVDNSKQLNWLPIPPKNVKILFTTLEDDRTMEVFKNRHYPVFTLQPLSKGQREDMIRGYLGLYSKKLQPHQVERIVTDRQCENTLVLNTLLDELVNFGIFERLDEKIGTYLGTESVEDFYGILLKGYETDFGEPFVKYILSLIAVSRNGLSEKEILAITKETPLHWSQFFCAIHQHLIVKNGLVSFAHNFLRKAVEGRYLAGQKDWEDDCRKEIIAELRDKKTPRTLDEVPYQYDKLGDLKNLHDYLLDLEVFNHLYCKAETDLGNYWSHLINSGYSLEDYCCLLKGFDDSRKCYIFSCLSEFSRNTVVNPILCLKFIEQAVVFADSDDKRAVLMNHISASQFLLGNYPEALNSSLKALDLFGKMPGHQSDIDSTYYNLGHIYSSSGDSKNALKYSMKALTIRREIYGDNHLSTASSFNAVGYAFFDQQNYVEAFNHQSKALSIRKNVLGEFSPDVAESYNDVGLTLLELGYYQDGLEYELSALKIYRCVFGDSHPFVATAYNNVGIAYGKMGKYNNELDCMSNSLRIRKNCFGDSHPIVATTLNNIGMTYNELGDYQKAIDCIHKALAIRLTALSESHMDTIKSYINLISVYDNIGDYAKSLEYSKKVLVSQIKAFGESNKEVAITYNNIGAIYGLLGNHNDEIAYRIKGLDIAIRINDSNLTATLFNRVGRAYKADGKQETANDYFRKAAEKFRELGDDAQEVESLKEIVD